MAWCDLSALRERPDVHSALMALSPAERPAVTAALQDAGSSMALFLRSFDPALSGGLASPEMLLAGTTIRAQIGLGVYRVVVAATLGSSPRPLTLAIDAASREVERRAVRLAIARLARLHSAIDVDIEKPHALHGLLIRLVQQPGSLVMAAELAERSGAMELALDGFCRHPRALAAQVTALLSTGDTRGVPGPVLAALWVLTLRGCGHRLGSEENTIGYSDHALVA